MEEKRQEIINNIKNLLDSKNAKRVKISFTWGFYHGFKFREIIWFKEDDTIYFEAYNLLYNAELVNIDILEGIWWYLCDLKDKLSYS